MSLPERVSRERWLVARKELLVREKALTRQRDALNADRRRLPMVVVDKEYVFEGVAGKAGLLDLFNGHRQLIVQHVMFDPGWDDACPACTADLDELAAGVLRHLSLRDTSFAAVSRAPFDKLAAYQARHGWEFDWYSSFGSDFNYDFHVTMDENVAPVEYNYRSRDELGAGSGELGRRPTELGGMSCFLLDGDTVCHTYSAYGRGTDHLIMTYALLDLTALGRQEDWEQPRGRVGRPHKSEPTFAT